MRKAILILISFLFGLQFASAQYYYFNKGYEYLDLGWWDSAFMTFRNGMNHGELASLEGVLYCYLTETGTPRDIPQAEALMAKYYTKDPDVCIMAANYYAGFVTKFDANRVIYYRSYYSNRKNDPAMALKYAHYYLDHWDYEIRSGYSRSASLDAFHVLMDYEIGGRMNGKYGFRQEPDKAIDVYLKWVNRNSISGTSALSIGLNYGGYGNGWFHCLLRQIIYYSKDTQDFIEKCKVLKKRGAIDSRAAKLDVMPELLYPGARPYRWEVMKNVKTCLDYIDGCTSVEQAYELQSALADIGMLDKFLTDKHLKYSEALSQKIKDISQQEEAASEERARIWLSEHFNDRADDMRNGYEHLSPAVKSKLFDVYADQIQIRIDNANSEDGLRELRTRVHETEFLLLKNFDKRIDDAILKVRNEKWSDEQYEELRKSNSIPGLAEFVKDSRTTESYRTKAGTLLDQLKKEKKVIRDKEIRDLVDSFKSSDMTGGIMEADIIMGSPLYEVNRGKFKTLRAGYDDLKQRVEGISAEYPYLAPNNSLKDLEREYADKLSFGNLIILEDSGSVTVEDYENFAGRSPSFYPSYIRDGYAIARANHLTKQSSSKEIKEVKQLPMSPAAKALVTNLTKKSYLSRK